MPGLTGAGPLERFKDYVLRKGRKVLIGLGIIVDENAKRRYLGGMKPDKYAAASKSPSRRRRGPFRLIPAASVRGRRPRFGAGDANAISNASQVLRRRPLELGAQGSRAARNNARSP